MLQLPAMRRAAERLQRRFGGAGLRAIPGAGRCAGADTMFVFMNPTARNTSSHPSWPGLRAPWLGTAHVWRMFERTGFLSRELAGRASTASPTDWTPEFCAKVYRHLASRGAYVTNLAKCTQVDARPLPDAVFRHYLSLMVREIALVRPKRVIAFGNQVSSILLGRPVSVSDFPGGTGEPLIVGGRAFAVYPTYYPVGQGMRNMPRAIRRIRTICKIT